MDITLQEFLRRKGAIGLLSLLHERPMTYSEIEPEIEVTSDTIITRRDEAAELGLLNISLGEAGDGTKKVYHLTDMGEFLADTMAREGLISNYRKMRTLEELVDEQTAGLIGWVEDHPSQLLQFEEAKDGTILRNQSTTENPANTGGETREQSQDDVGETPIESSRSDSSLEPPQQPSERVTSDDTEPVEDGGESDERPQRPSDSIPDHVGERDTSNTSQGSLSDVAPADSDTDDTTESDN